MKKEVEGFVDREDISMEEGRKIIMVGSKEMNDGGKTAIFIEKDTVGIPAIVPAKLPNPGSFSIPYDVGKAKIEIALCDLDASVSLMPYSMFHKLHLGSL